MFEYKNGEIMISPFLPLPNYVYLIRLIAANADG